MSRVLHISDLHYSAETLKWVDRAVTHAIETGIREGCTLAIVSGDSFDHALAVHEPAVSAYVRQIVTLSGFMPVVVLQGTPTHDRPGCLDILKAMPVNYPILVADAPGTHEIAGVAVSALPSVNKADTGFDLAATLAGFAAENRAARANGMPTLVVSHGTVTGCVTESGFAMVSPDHEFSLDLLASAEADAVLLGHIHAHQAWPGVATPGGHSCTIAYAGSLARLTHGHTGPVGFLIWDIEPGRARCTFCPSPSRQLLHIEFDGPPDLQELKQIAKSVQPEDAVRIRYCIDEERAASVHKTAIRELFSHAESLKLEGRILPVQRVRAAGIGRAITLSEKLAYWAQTTGSADALARLQERLDQLQGADTDAIVARLVGDKPNTNRKKAA